VGRIRTARLPPIAGFPANCSFPGAAGTDAPFDLFLVSVAIAPVIGNKSQATARKPGIPGIRRGVGGPQALGTVPLNGDKRSKTPACRSRA
jgi:hypothetical protein